MIRYISLLLFIGLTWGQEYDPETGDVVKKQYDPETGEVVNKQYDPETGELIKDQKANPINSSNNICLTIPKSTHHLTNKKPHECGAKYKLAARGGKLK